MNAWVKELRAEIGRRKQRRKLSQSELAELLNVGLSAVAKWEMEKSPQQPERDSYLKLFRLASPELRARAPQVVDLPEVSDPDRTVPPENTTGERYVTNHRDAAIVAEELDGIEDPALRRRARNAALQAIEAELVQSHPSELGAGKLRRRAQHS